MMVDSDWDDLSRATVIVETPKIAYEISSVATSENPA